MASPRAIGRHRFAPCDASILSLSHGILLAATLTLFSHGCGKDDPAPSGPFTVRVSVGTGGLEATGGMSGVPAVSADGRFIAFASEASNLVADDTNGQADVFVHDRATGLTHRVSVTSAGAQAVGGGSRGPSISGDGRYVAFESDATNLVSNDTNTVTDIFLHDRQTGETSRVSIASSGGQAVGLGSFGPAISADGQQVAFASGASNLVLGDSNGLTDIFVRDRTANVTSRVSVSTGGGQATGPAGALTPAVSADGRIVAFASAQSDLVANDTNNAYDVFVHDRLTGETTRVSVATGGAQAAGGASDSPALNADGSIVAFRSSATNVVAADSNGVGDVFVRDLTAGQTVRVSVGSGDTEAAGSSTLRNGGLTDNGRFVVFQSAAANLVAEDTNSQADVFVHDRTTGQTTRQSVGSGGAEASGGESANPVISSNGALVVFDSFADNLMVGDTNGQLDVFAASRR